MEVLDKSCIPTVGAMHGGLICQSIAGRLRPESDTILYLDPGFPVNKIQTKFLGLKEDWGIDYVRTTYKRWFQEGKEPATEPNISEIFKELRIDSKKVMENVMTDAIENQYQENNFLHYQHVLLLFYIHQILNVQKIYQNHKELFDFIYEHKPEVVDDLRKSMREELPKRNWMEGSENKYYVRSD